jgi:hypothetical protein
VTVAGLEGLFDQAAADGHRVLLVLTGEVVALRR